MSSTSSQGVEEIPREDIDLDEVIGLPKFDLSTITLEKIQILQEVLKRKTQQDKLYKEHKQRQVVYDVKGILADAFEVTDLSNDKSIIEKLVHIVDKVNSEDI